MSFNDIVNQDKAKKIIASQLEAKRIPHAFLFLGHEGTGRKKFALELAKTLNCKNNSNNPLEPCDECISCNKINNNLHPDVQVIGFEWQARLEDKEVEKQKAIKIDTIRELQKEVNLKPSEGKWKIFIIEPAEKITLEAANCLLKTLEEPPQWTVIILLALHKENLPATVVSRTQIITFAPLPQKEIESIISKRFSISSSKAAEIAAISEGSISNAARHLEEDLDEAKTFWKKIKDNSLENTEALAASQQNSKNAFEFLSQLLLLAKQDFRKDPGHFKSCIESIMSSLSLLEQNVNPQMIMDVLFIKLKLTFNRSSLCQ
jgi:DNA polymerase-3 subunit delta'